MLKVAGTVCGGFITPGLGSWSFVRGGVPRTKPQGLYAHETSRRRRARQSRDATAVRRLLSELSTEELEPLAVEVIREHRRHLQRAQELFEGIESPTGVEGLVQRRHDYRMALLNLHGQHQLVGLVVAALGYVPDVDDPSSATTSPN